MTLQEQLSAKATNTTDRSDALVVSFGAAWQKHVIGRDFSLVIRKRVPRVDTFHWLYLYLNSPLGSICARTEISSISHIPAQEAIDRAHEINLSAAEIASYIGTDELIGCYKIGALEIAPSPASAAAIRARMVFYPPQSFFILSKQGKSVLDELAGYTKGAGRRSAKGRST